MLKAVLQVAILHAYTLTPPESAVTMFVGVAYDRTYFFFATAAILVAFLVSSKIAKSKQYPCCNEIAAILIAAIGKKLPTVKSTCNVSCGNKNCFNFYSRSRNCQL